MSNPELDAVVNRIKKVILDNVQVKTKVSTGGISVLAEFQIFSEKTFLGETSLYDAKVELAENIYNYLVYDFERLFLRECGLLDDVQQSTALNDMIQ